MSSGPFINSTNQAPGVQTGHTLAGFYTKMNVWGSLGLNFEYDGGPIIEIGGPIFLYKLRILEGSTSFREGSISVVLRSVILRAMFGPLPIFWGAI